MSVPLSCAKIHCVNPQPPKIFWSADQEYRQLETVKRGAPGGGSNTLPPWEEEIMWPISFWTRSWGACMLFSSMAPVFKHALKAPIPNDTGKKGSVLRDREPWALLTKDGGPQKRHSSTLWAGTAQLQAVLMCRRQAEGPTGATWILWGKSLHLERGGTRLWRSNCQEPIPRVGRKWIYGDQVWYQEELVAVQWWAPKKILALPRLNGPIGLIAKCNGAAKFACNPWSRAQHSPVNKLHVHSALESLLLHDWSVLQEVKTKSCPGPLIVTSTVSAQSF